MTEKTKTTTKTVEIPDQEPVKAPAKRGRPRKKDVEAKKAGNRGKVGRPPGDAARINEFKARLLATSGDKVINKIIDIALDDEHQGQMAALKMCMDRVLPVSYFEKDKATNGKSAVSITITGVGGDTTIIGEDSNEGEIIDVTPESSGSD